MGRLRMPPPASEAQDQDHEGSAAGVSCTAGGGICCQEGICGRSVCALISSQNRQASTKATSFSRQLRVMRSLDCVAHFMALLLVFVRRVFIARIAR